MLLDTLASLRNFHASPVSDLKNMKTQLQINIGLNSGTGPCAPHLLLADLRHRGFIVSASRIALGEWEGKPEATLVVACSYVLPLEYAESRLCIRAALTEIARHHHQECVAITWPDGSGELIPPVAEFDAGFFHAVTETRVSTFGTSLL